MSKIQKPGINEGIDRIHTRDALEEALNPSSELPWPSPNVMAPVIGQTIWTTSAHRLDLAPNAGVAFAVIMRAASDAVAGWASSQNPTRRQCSQTSAVLLARRCGNNTIRARSPFGAAPRRRGTPTSGSPAIHNFVCVNRRNFAHLLLEWLLACRASGDRRIRHLRSHSGWAARPRENISRLVFQATSPFSITQ
jgi:hypothetical protein